MRKTGTLLSIAVAALLLLPGCVSLTASQPPPDRYDLHPDAEMPSVFPAPAGFVMEIAAPHMPPGLGTDRIALYLEGGRRLDYYAGKSWAAPLDEVLHSFIHESARQAFPGAVIARPGLGAHARYRLAVTVNEFAPVYPQGPESLPAIRVSMTFALVRLRDENIVSSFTLSGQRAVAANTMSAVAAGLETALQDVLRAAFRKLAPVMSAESGS